MVIFVSRYFTLVKIKLTKNKQTNKQNKTKTNKKHLFGDFSNIPFLTKNF